MDFVPVPKPPKKEKKKPAGLKRSPIKQKVPKKKPIVFKPKVNKPPKKKNKTKVERDGIKLPSAKQRNSFSTANYQDAVLHFGIVCNDPNCGLMAGEMHHIVFRSQSGRGVWRNAVPLCKGHHDKCHKERAYNDYWKEQRRKQFGEHFYKDKYDVWMMGSIESPDEELFQKFMESQGGE